MSLVKLHNRMAEIRQQNEALSAELKAILQQADQHGGITAVAWARSQEIYELTQELGRDFDKTEAALYRELGEPMP